MKMDVFARRRQNVVEKLGKTSVLVLAAAPEVVIGRDTELRYVADAELYYLTGYTEPEAILVLSGASDAPFTMFVRPRDPAREQWTGSRDGIEAARDRFGADDVHPINQLSQHLPALLATADVLYARLGAGRPDLDGLLQRALADARSRRSRTGLSPHTLTDPGEILDSMRLLKDEAELLSIREAARITSEAFIETLARIRAGVGEWEVESSVEYGFRSRGADSPAFPTIAASGANATVLHYITNNAVARAGDLLLLDAGARFHMYCADMTRTVAVSGKFTQEQRDLYDVVLAAHDAAIEATRPGAPVDAPHEAAQQILARGLIDLGLLKGTPEEVIADPHGLKRYYPHRSSHWLGLEVHDVGAYTTREAAMTFAPNMVLTIEPGLYIPERGIGIRIEDDVLVTESGREVLTAAVPT